MPPVFKEHKDNAIVQIATSGDLNNTTTPLTLSVASGTGTKLATIVNGQWITVWDKVTYPDPGDDPNMERALITARSTDSITLARPNAVAHAGTPYLGELFRSQHLVDVEAGIWFDAVVGASGKGNYATLSAALTAGARSIFIRRGSYTETTALSTSWTGTSQINIVGEDRGGVILSLAANASGYLNLNISRSKIENLTITIPTTALGSSTTGWVNVPSGITDVIIRNISFNGANSNVAGAGICIASANCTIDSCKFSGGAPNNSWICINAATDNCVVRCTVSESRNVPCLYAIGGSDRLKINQCDFSNTGCLCALSLSGANSMLSDSRINITGSGTAFGSNGIVYANSTSGGSGMVNCQVTQNWGAQTSGNTIHLNTNSYMRVVGNFVDISSGTTAGTQMGISCQDGGYSTIVGNVIRGSANMYRGIYLGGTGYSTATANVTLDFNQNDTGTPRYGVGILIANGSVDNQAIGNIFKNCTGNVEDNDGGHRVLDSEGQLKAIAATTTTTLDLVTYSGYRVTLGLNTTFAFTENPLPNRTPARMSRIFHLKQDATGSRTVTWPSNILWAGGSAPTLTTAANKVDIVTLVWDRVEQKWLGSAALNY